MKLHKHEEGLAHIGLTLLILIVLSGIGVAIYHVYSKSSKSDSGEPLAQSAKAISKDEFFNASYKNLKAQNFNKLQKIEIQKNKDSGFTISNDDDYITTVKSPVIQLKFSGDNPCPDDTSSDGCDSSTAILEKLPQIKLVNKTISTLAEKYGLKVDTANTRSDINYSGYKNNAFMCELSDPSAEYGTPDIPASEAVYTLSFGCIDTSEYNKQHTLQKELINALGTPAYNDVTYISIEQQKDGFIYGSTQGGYAVWKESAGGWKYLFGGAEEPLCNDIDGHGIPKEFGLDQCIDASGQSRAVR